MRSPRCVRIEQGSRAVAGKNMLPYNLCSDFANPFLFEFPGSPLLAAVHYFGGEKRDDINQVHQHN